MPPRGRPTLVVLSLVTSSSVASFSYPVLKCSRGCSNSYHVVPASGSNVRTRASQRASPSQSSPIQSLSQKASRASNTGAPIVILQVNPLSSEALLRFRIDYLRRAFRQLEGRFEAWALFWADDAERLPDLATRRRLSLAFPGRTAVVDRARIDRAFPAFFDALPWGGEKIGALGGTQPRWPWIFTYVAVLAAFAPRRVDTQPLSARMQRAPYVWYVEYDVQWTGDLGAILADFPVGNGTYYASDVLHLPPWSRWWATNLTNFRGWTERSSAQLQLNGWPPRLLQLMAHHTRAGRVSYCEMFAATICASEPWCRVEDVVRVRPARFPPPGWRAHGAFGWRPRTNTLEKVCRIGGGHNATSGQLFHPVKVRAGNGTAEPASDCDWVSNATLAEWGTPPRQPALPSTTRLESHSVDRWSSPD